MQKYEPFGQVAVRLGFTTQGQVNTALQIQSSLEHAGKGRKLLGMIMLETGLISSAQLIEVLQYYAQRQAEETTEVADSAPDPGKSAS